MVPIEKVFFEIYHKRATQKIGKGSRFFAKFLEIKKLNRSTILEERCGYICALPVFSTSWCPNNRSIYVKITTLMNDLRENPQKAAFALPSGLPPAPLHPAPGVKPARVFNGAQKCVTH